MIIWKTSKIKKKFKIIKNLSQIKNALEIAEEIFDNLDEKDHLGFSTFSELINEEFKIN